MSRKTTASKKIYQYCVRGGEEMDVENMLKNSEKMPDEMDSECSDPAGNQPGAQPAGAGEANDSGRSDKKRKINGDGRKPVPEPEGSDRELLIQLINKVDAMVAQVSKIDFALNRIEKNTVEIQNVKEKQDSAEFDMIKMQDQIKEQDKLIRKLKDRMIDLSAREMRNTTVFFGFPEGAEQGGDCQGLIKSFAESHLQMKEDLGIERAHRSGQQPARSGPPRPIMVAFNRFTTKSSILSNARKYLKEKKFEWKEKKCAIFVEEMLPREIREQRKDLREMRKKLKEEHGQAYFKFPARLFYRDKTTKKEVEYKID